MASITFHANVLGESEPSGINHAAGSGLGFYGASYGISVPVSQYQDSTWVTNSNGTAVDAIPLNNVKFVHLESGNVNSTTTYALSGVPNIFAPLNIRFAHDEPVRVQNCKLRIFDRNDISRQASGVTTFVYEIRHPNPSPLVAGALEHRETDHEWYQEFDGVEIMTDYALTSSPGVSGLNTVVGDTLPATGTNGYVNWTTKEGTAHENERHDWYVALSASPQSIGSKTDYGLYFTCEYL
jgi:hypothetical protein